MDYLYRPEPCRELEPGEEVRLIYTLIEERTGARGTMQRRWKMEWAPVKVWFDHEDLYGSGDDSYELDFVV
jgi:hypothetical protein